MELINRATVQGQGTKETKKELLKAFTQIIDSYLKQVPDPNDKEHKLL